MGIPVVVKGNMHICPMMEGTKPHVGGIVSETSISGVTINGKPVAVEGDKCTCTGGSSPDKIMQGCQGVLVDGKPIAILGSMTEHGGVLIEGMPGVTISGPLVPLSGDPKKLEPKIFNLRWMKGKELINSDFLNEEVIFKASTVGYEDGEEVDIKLYNNNGDIILDQKAIVTKGEVEVKLSIENEHFVNKEDNVR